MNSDDRSAAMPDDYDRLRGSLDGLPDVTASRPSTIKTTVPILGHTQTWIVETLRQSRGDGKPSEDTIFLEMVDRHGSFRRALPPAVSDAIARQREGLMTKVRKKHGRRIAAERKERGEHPAFARKRAGGE